MVKKYKHQTCNAQEQENITGRYYPDQKLGC